MKKAAASASPCDGGRLEERVGRRVRALGQPAEAAEARRDDAAPEPGAEAGTGRLDDAAEIHAEREGQGGVDRRGSPKHMSTSLKLSDTAATRTRTRPGPGSASAGTSTLASAVVGGP